MLLAEEGGGRKPEGERRRHVSDQTPVRPGKDWGGGKMLDDTDRKLLKSLLNEGWRQEGSEAARGENKDGGETPRVKSPLKETRARGGKSKRADERPRRQDSRFDRSMRVLEWLDADCGTRLARHYEQAGGWRQHGNIYLPQSPKQPPQPESQKQQLQPQPRQPLRLTRSNIIIDTGLWRGYVKDSEEDSSSFEEKKVLEESEDDFVNDEPDDDDLVLTLRKWQEEQLLAEHYEDLSMQDYVTSSEDDENDDDDSDSEDELVLALKHWQDEQKRQQQLQLQQHRQSTLSQIAPALTPVQEEKAASPSSEAFKYFYQDPHHLICHFNRQRHKNHQQISSPSFWGDIGSVREGPSSPPVNARNLEAAKTSNSPQRPGSKNSSRPQATRGPGNEVTSKPGQASLGPSLLVPTSLLSSISPAPSLTPVSPLASSSLSLSPSSREVRTPFSTSPELQDNKDASDGSFLKSGFGAYSSGASGKLSCDDAGTKNSGGVSPRSPLISKTSGGGSFLSGWLGSASGDGPTSPLISSSGEASSLKVVSNDGDHRAVCPTSSTASQDSGIEKSPGYLSPAPRSAGIEKIGKFFRQFQNKLSPTVVSSAASSIKTPPPTPTTPNRQHFYPQHLKVGVCTTGKLSHSTSSIPSPSPTYLKPQSPSPIAGFAAQHAICSATKSDPLASGTVPKRHLGTWWGGQQQTAGTANQHGRALQTNSTASADSTAHNNAGTVGTNDSAAPAPACAASLPHSQGDRKVAHTIDTSLAVVCVGDRQRSPGGPNSGAGKVLVGGKDAQPFIVPQTYQYLHQHQFLTPKKSGEINKKNPGTEANDGGEARESGSQSASRACVKDTAETVKRCNEALDGSGPGNEAVSAAGNGGFSVFTRGVTQILRKSPVSEIEQKIHSDSGERDPHGKSRTGAAAGGVSGDGVAGGAVCDAGGAPVRSMTDNKKKGAAGRETVITSRCSERSSSTSSDEKGALTVPSNEPDRGRRGSYGTCNHLFLEQASGRKSPLPQKVRKSPSPVRRSLFKSVVNSSNSSSSSSADSPSKQHAKAGRVLSSSSPSSPPPHLQQADKSSPQKTSPKHLTSPQHAGGLDSPTRKTIASDGPPANYRGRRKFSDTGLTPVPRRLFSDGRRGSLTDERTLVSAKSKLGKLRFQGRKSSDASSVAALVKQIHNLWGDGEDEEETSESVIERRDSASGLHCSLDDQALFDKRRKKFPFTINKDKDPVSAEGKNKINSPATTAGDNSPVIGCSGAWEVKGRAKNSDKDSAPPVNLPSPNVSAQNASSVLSGEVGCQTPDRILHCGLAESVGNDLPAASALDAGGAAGGGVVGNCSGAVGGSEFVAPIAQVASRQLVATAVSSAACYVGLDTTDALLQRAATTQTSGSANSSVSGSPAKTGKKTATVQFQPIISWDDNTVGEKVSPALRSVLKLGTRRHSSFAGFSDSCDNLSASSPIPPPAHIAAVLNKQAKNGLPKSKTSDNYKSILKQSSVNLDSSTSSSSPEKKRAKSPSPKSRKNEKGFDYSPDPKNSEISLSLCLKATRSVSPKSKKYRGDNRDLGDFSSDLPTQATSLSSTEKDHLTDSGNCSLDLPTKTVGVQATPRTIGKTSNTGTQTTDPPTTCDLAGEYSSSPTENSGWLQRLAAKCMASVGGTGRAGSPAGAGGSGGLPRAASVRAEWLLGSKRMGSSPSSPVAPGSDASEKFWVPHDVIARKRAQSLVPTLSKQESEDGE
ncbi:uncharacterized protein LOC131933311 [Physella acuta]|uniref:uncharacterized protein LOC131933311 n=1 Tax=Physella acuta TaxID=109671 RepID=UPI0027DD5C8D|nr:uncharacterized protein LOC131933311 [Physella acuta]